MAFGKFVPIQGSTTSKMTTLYPIDLFRYQNHPIPVTFSSTTWSINASVTDGVEIWSGNDVVSLREAMSYDFNAAGNQLNATTGAVESLSLAAGMWYMYLGYASDVLTLLPSTAAPSLVQGKFDNGPRSHPGTARTAFWNYVGMCPLSAATPTILDFAKIGKTYVFAQSNAFTIATSGTSYAERTPVQGSVGLPGHGALGLKVGGSLESGPNAADITHMAMDSSGRGEIQAKGGAQAGFSPFAGFPISGATVYLKHTGAAGDIHITQFEDIV